MEVIDSLWFNSMYGSFGIVLGKTDRGERRLYAGVARGHDRKADEQSILDYGNKVAIPMLEALIARAKQKGD